MIATTAPAVVVVVAAAAAVAKSTPTSQASLWMINRMYATE
jgi:hypothetical protein